MLCFSACILQIVCDILEANREGVLKGILSGQTYEFFIFAFPILNIPLIIIAKNNIPTLIDLLKEPFVETVRDAKHKTIIKDFHFWSFVLGTITFMFNAIVINSIMVFGPLISLSLLPDGTPIREWPLPVGRIPFDTDSRYVYVFAYVTSAFSMLSTSLNYASWCIIMIFSSLKINARIAILRDTILSLDERAEILCLTMTDQAPISQALQQKKEVIQQCFKTLFHEQIREHQSIIRFRNFLNM